MIMSFILCGAVVLKNLLILFRKMLTLIARSLIFIIYTNNVYIMNYRSLIVSTIVPTLSQALLGIERFEDELKRSAELRRRLAFARAWYAHKTEDGVWRFAPSKFCGYKDMTAEEYSNDDARDGRRTEKQLQSWFTQVPETDALYEELSESLTAFLDKYGKPPSAAIRISVTNEFFQNRGSAEDAPSERTVADLLIAVAQGLTPAERARVRAAL